MVTDYQLLYSIFNEISKGLTRTERRKLRHQDIRYKVIVREEKLSKMTKITLKMFYQNLLIYTIQNFHQFNFCI